MYVKVKVKLGDAATDGDTEHVYEVSGCVSYDPGGHGWSGRYFVEDITFSAPDCNIEDSRLAADPEAGGVFLEGWSDYVEEEMLKAYKDAECAHWEAMAEAGERRRF